jgi:hypothetical protein
MKLIIIFRSFGLDPDPDSNPDPKFTADPDPKQKFWIRHTPSRVRLKRCSREKSDLFLTFSLWLPFYYNKQICELEINKKLCRVEFPAVGEG